MTTIKPEYLNKVTIFLPKEDSIFLSKSTTEDEIKRCLLQKGNEKFFNIEKKQTAKELIEEIGNVTNIDKLYSMLGNETRKGVVKAIEAKIKSMEA